MKTNCSIILFTNKCCTTFNGSNRWNKVWVVTTRNCSYKLRSECGMMFPGGIIGGKVVGPNAFSKIIFIHDNAMQSNFIWRKKTQTEQMKELKNLVQNMK